MSPPKNILLVDDDARLRQRLGRALSERGIDVALADGHAAALAHARAKSFEAAIVDMRMPGPGGLQLITDLLACTPTMFIVVLTGYGSIATAVAAIRLGARDYLTKPCHADQILGAFCPAQNKTSSGHEVPSLHRVEREHIERVLHDCGYNVSRAARVLGIHRRTLQYKLAKDPVSR